MGTVRVTYINLHVTLMIGGYLNHRGINNIYILKYSWYSTKGFIIDTLCCGMIIKGGVGAGV